MHFVRLGISDEDDGKESPISLLEPISVTKQRKSVQKPAASKIDEVEDYMELTELTDFEELTFDPAQMTAIIDKEENITFTQDLDVNLSHGNFSVIATADVVNEEITLSEGGKACTYKIQYPSMNDSMSDDDSRQSSGGSKPFACRHCGKEYRWKSTLRRHENVECGGKAPSYECPYCEYKAKQRGNLGVHVRKHHPELPQLESKRKRSS